MQQKHPAVLPEAERIPDPEGSMMIMTPTKESSRAASFGAESASFRTTEERHTVKTGQR